VSSFILTGPSPAVVVPQIPDTGSTLFVVDLSAKLARGIICEIAMRVKFVVMGEPSRQRLDDGCGVWLRIDGDATALKRANEGLHSIGLRTLHGRVQGQEADVLRELRVSAAV
jgi:hypothetical protein